MCTATELWIARSLALQVSILSREQIVRGWFAQTVEGDQAAAVSLHRLQDAQLICRRIVEAHPIVPLNQPLLAWSPGNPEPTQTTLVQTAFISNCRWLKDESPVEVFCSSPLAARLFGSFGNAGRIKPCEATHDLHLSEVFIRYLTKTPTLARKWIGERALPKIGFLFKGMKDPDAFLIDQNRKASRIVEFSGRYSIDHLRAFHQHCSGVAAQRLARCGLTGGSGFLASLYAEEGTRYEIW